MTQSRCLTDIAVDPESILTVIPKRPTLWLFDYIVPILPRRKPFIASLDAPEEC